MPAPHQIELPQITDLPEEPLTTLLRSLLSSISHRHDSLHAENPAPQNTGQTTPPTPSACPPAAPKDQLPRRYHLQSDEPDNCQLFQHLILISVLLTPAHRRPVCHYHRLGICRYGRRCYYHHPQRTTEEPETANCFRVHTSTPEKPFRSRAYAYHTFQHSIETYRKPKDCNSPAQFSRRAILFDSQVVWTSRTYASPNLPSTHYLKPEVREESPSHPTPRRTKATIFQTSQLYVEAPYRTQQDFETNALPGISPAPNLNPQSQPFASETSRFKSPTVWDSLKDEGNLQSCEDDDNDWYTVTKTLKKPQNGTPGSTASTHRCVECCRRWTLEESTQQWFKNKGWPIPKRCQACRDRRKSRTPHHEPKTPRPLHIHQVPFSSEQRWNVSAERQELQSAETPPPSPTSSQTPSPPRGRFWDDTEDSDTNAAPTKLEPLNYWNDSSSVYDTPAEQESLLCPNEPAFHQSLSEILSTVFHTHFSTTETWHINAPQASLFPIVPADSDSDIEMPYLQSSSSDSDKSSITHQGNRSDSLESFNLPDLATSSLPTFQHACNPEDLGTDQKNIYAILAMLCTVHDLSAIQGLYRLYEELPWFPRGKDLTSDSLFDILFDSSLKTPSLIKYLQSSRVPHTTVEMCIKIRATDTFPKMQAIYHELIEKQLWDTFRTDAYTVLQD